MVNVPKSKRESISAVLSNVEKWNHQYPPQKKVSDVKSFAALLVSQVTVALGTESRTWGGRHGTTCSRPGPQKLWLHLVEL